MRLLFTAHLILAKNYALTFQFSDMGFARR